MLIPKIPSKNIFILMDAYAYYQYKGRNINDRHEMYHASRNLEILFMSLQIEFWLNHNSSDSNIIAYERHRDIFDIKNILDEIKPLLYRDYSSVQRYYNLGNKRILFRKVNELRGMSNHQVFLYSNSMSKNITLSEREEYEMGLHHINPKQIYHSSDLRR